MKQIRMTLLDYIELIDCASANDQVRRAVLASHDENPWWPNDVDDWRMRMIIAGLSTRVSFRMLTTYEAVLNKIKQRTYLEVSKLSDDDLLKLIQPLGMGKSRVIYVRSMIAFIQNIMRNKKPEDYSVRELISLICEHVKGAAYKVGQCCVLYSRGYYSGLMPVDSGMRDMLAPCMGLSAPKIPYGHEIVRFQLEELAKLYDWKMIALKNGYGGLKFPESGALTWWLHLVLINYKRFFCNNRKPSNCLFHQCKLDNRKIGSMCATPPISGGARLLLIEGCSGAGKTKLVERLKDLGYLYTHFSYDDVSKDIFEKYSDLLQKQYSKRIAFDRGFISEHVYGSVIRGGSRLTDKQFNQLMQMLYKNAGSIVYLYAPADLLIGRIKKRAKKTNNAKINIGDYSVSTMNRLLHRYEDVLSPYQNIVEQINTDKYNEESVLTRCLFSDIDRSIERISSI